MKKNALKTLALTLFLITNTSFAWTTARDAAERLGATKVTEVSFKKGTAEVSKDEAELLRDALKEAGATGKVKSVKVLVWSDKEYPTPDAKADKKDVKLAKDRAQKLKSILKKDLKAWDVSTHNMAERPNAVEKLLRTPDAKIKEKAETAGIAPDDNKELGLFDHNAHASKAVVLIFAEK